jgi:hypothetical protein
MDVSNTLELTCILCGLFYFSYYIFLSLYHPKNLPSLSQAVALISTQTHMQSLTRPPPFLAGEIYCCLLHTFLIGSPLSPAVSLLFPCFIALQINYPCPTVRTWIKEGRGDSIRRLILILICAWDLAHGVRGVRWLQVLCNGASY